MEGAKGGQFGFSANWTTLKPAELNNGDYHWVNKGTTSATFTLTEEMLETIISKGSLGFKVEDVIVTKVIITGAGTENPDALYAGQYGIAHKFFTSEMSAFAGKGIKVTVKYRKTKAEADSYWITLTQEWSDVSGYIGATADSGTLEATIDATKVDAIIAAGTWCGIKVNGLIIESFAITEAD